MVMCTIPETSIILAIETSSETASVALLCGTRMTSRQASGAQTHSEAVLPMVQSLLADAGLPITQCSAIAFGAGPGSFTGVRTACGVAQGLAFGANLPILAINTLEAMADACHRATGALAVLPMLDARMGEVYWAQYAFDQAMLGVIAPRLSLPSEVEPTGPVLACGNALRVYADQFSDASLCRDAQVDLMPHAEQIARLAQVALAAGHHVAARDAQPIYLRNNVALTTAERLEKNRRAA